MSKEKKPMDVNKYREKHKRCKTCEYALVIHDFRWRCRAKGTEHYINLGESGLRGCFCKIYIARFLG